MLELLGPFGVRELVQSGLVALGRGSRSITDRDRALRPAQGHPRRLTAAV